MILLNDPFVRGYVCGVLLSGTLVFLIMWNPKIGELPWRKRSPYLTAAKLGILPEERTALIAFIEAPALGRIVSVNGHAHFYDQSHAENDDQAEKNECGTAGCIAGFVLAHVQHVQGKKKLRGEDTAGGYIGEACREEFKGYNRRHERKYETVTPLLNKLYQDGKDRKLVQARQVAENALRTGKVKWPYKAPKASGDDDDDYYQ